MQTKLRSNSVITHRLEPDGGLTFIVQRAGPPDPEGKPTPAEFTLDLTRVSEANRQRAMRHGFIQRIADAAAIARNTANGQPAAPADKLAAMRRLAEHYASGSEEWAVPREGGGGPGLDSVILAAVAEVTGKGIEEVRALVATQSEKRKVTPRAYLASLGTSAKVAEVVARIRGAEPNAVNADDELAEIAASE